MADRKFETFTVRPRSGQLTLPGASAVGMAMGVALTYALKELARMHDFKDGPWLDDLYARSMANAKGSHFTGLAIEHEADALQYGADCLDAAFKSLRSGLDPRDS